MKLIYNEKINFSILLLMLFVSSCSTDGADKEIWDSMKSSVISKQNDTNTENTNSDIDFGTKVIPGTEVLSADVDHVGNGKICIESEGQNLISIEISDDSKTPANTNWGDGCLGHITTKSFHQYDMPDKRNMVMNAPTSNGIKISSLSGITTIDLSEY